MGFDESTKLSSIALKTRGKESRGDLSCFAATYFPNSVRLFISFLSAPKPAVRIFRVDGRDGTKRKK
jgi:hypothetical protein